MRKIKYAFASSLDNFIAREDGSVDWLFMEGEHMAESSKIKSSLKAARAAT